MIAQGLEAYIVKKEIVFCVILVIVGGAVGIYGVIWGLTCFWSRLQVATHGIKFLEVATLELLFSLFHLCISQP